MAYMTWTEHFVTGVPLVDEQHKRLVDLVNEVAPHLVGVEHPDPIESAQVIGRLFEYADTHFRDEEAFMAETGLSPISVARHAVMHNGFVREVLALHRELEDGTLAGSTLLRFLSSWLTFHILGADQTMALQARLIAEGTDPERARLLAHEAEEADSAHAVLQGSLLELFALTQERSDALASANRELRKVSLELAELNTVLEAKVRERTADLVDANHALELERNRLVETLDELKRAELALIQSEKLRAVGQLAAGLAHEINTPLQVVGDSLAFLAEGATALRDTCADLAVQVDETQRVEVEQRHETDYFSTGIEQAATRARNGITRASELVRAILEFAHPGGSQPVPTDLAHLLTNTLQVAHGQLDEIPVELELGPLPQLYCHPTALAQAVMNLLLNGRDAIREARQRIAGDRGRLVVRARAETDHVVIEIEDDGTGIPEEVVPHLYEPFFTTRPVGQGVGQGLSATRSAVVDLHGGRLSHTTRRGEGTTFCIRLPLRPEPPVTSP